MADLPEANEWPEGIYQLETSDPVLGGPEGIDNLQAKQLASRTKWLKDQIAKIIDGVSEVGKAAQLKTARTLRFKGAATGSGSYDGSADTEIALTLADMSWKKITSDKPTTLSGYGIEDTYTKHEIESMVAPATDTNRGTAKIATQSLTDVGVDDATIVTPKKLRFGFQIGSGTNGYIAFPSWLGGLVLQWGSTVLINSGSSVSVPMVIEFPNAILNAFISVNGSGNFTAALCGAVNATSKTAINVYHFSGGGGAANYRWLAVGR